MELPKYLITGCTYKLWGGDSNERLLSPEEYFLEHPERWQTAYDQKLSRLGDLGNSGNFNVGSLEMFPFNHETFFRDNGYSLINTVCGTGGGYFTVVKDA